MATADTQAAALFVERMRSVLPQAVTEAFAGATNATALEAGVLPLLLMDLDSGHHLHLELEVSAGRLQGRPLLIVMRPEDATALFGLDPVDPDQLGDPETQLRVLAEFTEGGEALSEALASVLTMDGMLTAMRVSGASLEEADASPIAAAQPLGDGDAVAFRADLERPGGAIMPVVVATTPELAGALAANAMPDDASGTAGSSAAERAASLAAKVAARQNPAPAETGGMPQLTPVQAQQAVTAHPFSFGQLDIGAPAPRHERNIDPILDVALQVRVELGSTEMTVEEVLALSIGSVVELDRLAGEPVDIVVNNRLLARGEVVVVEENFGVRVTELITQRARASA